MAIKKITDFVSENFNKEIIDGIESEREAAKTESLDSSHFSRYRGKLGVEADNEPTPCIGRIQITSTDGAIVCLKTKAQADWLLNSLKEAIQYAWEK